MGITLAQTKHLELVHTGVCGEGGSNSKTIINVYHYVRNAFVLPITKSEIFTAWKAAIGDKVILHLNERYTSQNVKIRILDDPEDRYSIHAFTDVGAIAGDSLPSHEASVLLLKSAVRGRFAQGRKHYAPLSESQIGDDVLNAGALTTIGAIKTGILAGFTDATGNVWKSCIVSKTYSDLQASPASIFSYVVNEVTITNNIGIMKNRKVSTVQS